MTVPAVQSILNQRWKAEAEIVHVVNVCYAKMQAPPCAKRDTLTLEHSDAATLVAKNLKQQ